MAAYLFTVEGKIVVPHPETLMISPYKEIWDRDTSAEKDMATLEFTYIEFMVSKKKTNPFKGYDASIRPEKILQSVKGFPEGWKPDELVAEGMTFLKDVQVNASASYAYYMSAVNGARKLQDFFNSFDMTDLNPRTGAPMYKPRDITSALKDTDDVLEKMNKLEKKVEEDIFDKTVTKANKDISPFANPDIM